LINKKKLSSPNCIVVWSGMKNLSWEMAVFVEADL